MPKSMATLTDMEERIGQGVFENPSVFSFFLPEFPAPGVIQQAGLVAPEGMVLQGDNVLSLLDSFFSTIKFGITAHTCYGWGGRMSSFDAWNHRSVSVLFILSLSSFLYCLESFASHLPALLIVVAVRVSLS